MEEEPVITQETPVGEYIRDIHRNPNVFHEINFDSEISQVEIVLGSSYYFTGDEVRTFVEDPHLKVDGFSSTEIEDHAGNMHDVPVMYLKVNED